MGFITDNTLKFARGTREAYDDASLLGTYRDYIYFTTNTKEILMYKDDSSTYGSYGYRGMIDDVSISVNSSDYTFNMTLNYADGSEQVMRSVSLKDIIQAVVEEESLSDIYVRLNAVENTIENYLTWKTIS